MSTRTNIVIKQGQGDWQRKITLYRHCDGYPAVTGEDVVNVLEKCDTLEEGLVLLLSEKYDATSYNPKSRNIYEVTSGVHGDIEYLYTIHLGRRDRIDDVRKNVVEVEKRTLHRDGSESWSIIASDVESLRDYTNRERVEMNKRIDRLAKESPKMYGDCELFELI